MFSTSLISSKVGVVVGRTTARDWATSSAMASASPLSATRCSRRAGAPSQLRTAEAVVAAGRHATDKY